MKAVLMIVGLLAITAKMCSAEDSAITKDYKMHYAKCADALGIPTGNVVRDEVAICAVLAGRYIADENGNYNYQKGVNAVKKLVTEPSKLKIARAMWANCDTIVNDAGKQGLRKIIDAVRCGVPIVYLFDGFPSIINSNQ